jgi:hypothetical protein
MAWQTGRLTMNEFVAVTSTNIAKILNMYPRKGAILVGADADIVVWDPKRSEKTISAASQQSSIDYNVFEGKHVTGLPRFTLTRGHVAIEETQVKTREGHGEFVARALHGGQQGAVDLEGPGRAAQGGTHRHPRQRGLSKEACSANPPPP